MQLHSRAAKRRRGKYSKFLAIWDELNDRQTDSGALSLSLYRTEREKEKEEEGYVHER